MNTLSIIIAIFVFGGILYNFQKSAEERGLDLFGMIYGLIRMIILVLAYPFMVMFDRIKNR